MDVSPRAIFTNFVPRIPGIFLVSILALFGWTENSSDQDPITQIIVAAARPILQTPAEIARSQQVWKVLGRCSAWFLDTLVAIRLGWLFGLHRIKVVQHIVTVAKATQKEQQMDATSPVDAVAFAFDILCNPQESGCCPMPDLVGVEVEWTTYHLRGEPYVEQLMEEKHGDFKRSETAPKLKPVILYLHGGAHCLMDPTTHRSTTNTLAKLTRTDICSVRFRLSPQQPFPAALLDAFLVYLSLLYPSDSASFRATPSSQIIFAGDSSGGSIAASLLLLLLTLSKHDKTIFFNNRTVRVPAKVCGGLALTSPWLDVTRSLPSTNANAKWDIIAPPPLDSASPLFPPDMAWPTSPPRAETYCTANVCAHPLVSPLAAKSVHWRGAPPVWVCSGWEGFTDEIEVFARRVYQSSPEAKVWFEGWQGMPHCFGMVPWNTAGREAMYAWAEFCARCARGNVERRTHGIWRATHGKNRGTEWQISMDKLGCEKEGVGYDRELPLTDKLVDQFMEKGRRWRIGLEHEMVKNWTATAENRND